MMNWSHVADSLAARAEYHLNQAESVGLSAMKDHHLAMGTIFTGLAGALRAGLSNETLRIERDANGLPYGDF
jgi:hypothetical protein